MKNPGQKIYLKLVRSTLFSHSQRHNQFFGNYVKLVKFWNISTWHFLMLSSNYYSFKFHVFSSEYNELKLGVKSVLALTLQNSSLDTVTKQCARHDMVVHTQKKNSYVVKIHCGVNSTRSFYYANFIAHLHFTMITFMYE